MSVNLSRSSTGASNCLLYGAVAAVLLVFIQRAVGQHQSASATLDFAFAQSLLCELSPAEVDDLARMAGAESDGVRELVEAHSRFCKSVVAEWYAKSAAIQHLQSRLDAARAERGLGDPETRRLADELADAHASYLSWRAAIRIDLVSHDYQLRDQVISLVGEKNAPVVTEMLARKRRERTLAAGAHFPAERVDLIWLVDSSPRLPEHWAEDHAPILDRYAADLDALLQQRNAALVEVRDADEGAANPTRLGQMMRDGAISESEYLKALPEFYANERRARVERHRPLIALQRSIAQTNTAYMDLLLIDAPPDLADDLLARFKACAYETEQVGDELTADQIIDAALGLPELSDFQRSSLMEIRDAYWIPRRHDLEQRLMSATDRLRAAWNETILFTPNAQNIRRQRSDLFDALLALEQTTLAKVYACLTEEQAAEVFTEGATLLMNSK